MKHLKGYSDFNKINEMTEFNLMRMNSDSSPMAPHVDNPQLSVNAYDKHMDTIRQATAIINDINQNLSSTSQLGKLRSKVLMDDQDITSLKVLRIIKSNNSYDAFISFIVDDYEYFGKITDLIGMDTDLKSEIFKDYDLYQPKEWVIKTKGTIIKYIRNWMKIKPGHYKCLVDSVICNDNLTGERLNITKNKKIEVEYTSSTKIKIKYKGKKYDITNDGYVYFNYWFEKID